MAARRRLPCSSTNGWRATPPRWPIRRTAISKTGSSSTILGPTPWTSRAIISLIPHERRGVVTNKFKYLITTNGPHIIPPQGYLLVWADNETGQNLSLGVPRPDMHVNFALSLGGEAIGLFAADGTQIDRGDLRPANQRRERGTRSRWRREYLLHAGHGEPARGELPDELGQHRARAGSDWQQDYFPGPDSGLHCRRPATAMCLRKR